MLLVEEALKDSIKIQLKCLGLHHPNFELSANLELGNRRTCNSTFPGYHARTLGSTFVNNAC